jgi:cell filamentation protein
MVLQRKREGVPKVRLTDAGYSAIHRHLFQDVYAWAGQHRTVNIAKRGALFCLVPHIAGQMERRFNLIQADTGEVQSRESFATRAAEHVCEINAIHPFREGDRRTLRAFPEGLASAAGHGIVLRLMDAKAWNMASIESFRHANHAEMTTVILAIP